MKDQIYKKVKEIAVNLTLPENQPTTLGIKYGKLGVILFLLEYYQFSQKSKYLQIAKRLTDEVNQDVSDANIKGRVSEILADFGQFIMYIKDRQLLASDFSNTLEILDELLFENMKNCLAKKDFDLVTGALVSGHYFISRARESPKIKDYIEQLIEELEQIAYEDSEGDLFWKSVIFNDERVYLGITHGSASILSFVAKAYDLKIAQAKCRNILKKGANFVLKSKLSGSDGNLYPLILNTNERVSLLGYAYGDLGLGWALFRASGILKDKRIQEAAFEIFLYSAMRRDIGVGTIKDGGLAYGSSGNAAIFYLIYKMTQGHIYKAAYEFWIAETLKRSNISENAVAGYKAYYSIDLHPGEDTGFITGVSGIGLTLLTYFDTDTSWIRRFLFL